ERTVDDPWLDLFEAAIGNLVGKIQNADVWEVVDRPADRRTQEDNARIGNVMKRLGFERKSLRFAGAMSKGYVRGAGAARERRIYLYRPYITDEGGAIATYLSPAKFTKLYNERGWTAAIEAARAANQRVTVAGGEPPPRRSGAKAGGEKSAA